MFGGCIWRLLCSSSLWFSQNMSCMIQSLLWFSAKTCDLKRSSFWCSTKQKKNFRSFSKKNLSSALCEPLTFRNCEQFYVAKVKLRCAANKPMSCSVTEVTEVQKWGVFLRGFIRPAQLASLCVHHSVLLEWWCCFWGGDRCTRRREFLSFRCATLCLHCSLVLFWIAQSPVKHGKNVGFKITRG